jgi:aspartate/methionine/tyrosine aminotransferase
VAVTPGRDFGHADTARYVRFSTASSMEHLREAVERLREMAP